MNLAENYIKRLKPSAERLNVRDDETGFGIRVEAASSGGRKSFFWNQKVNGQVYFRSLGEWPATSAKNARDRARELAGKAAKWKQAGCVEAENPFAKRTKALSPAGAPTFAVLVERYITDHLHNPTAKINHPASAEKSLRYIIAKYFKSWMDRPVDSIDVKDVCALRDSAGKHKFAGNRSVQHARAILGWCAETEGGRVNVWPLPGNPAAKIALADEVKRERWLRPEELATLETGLDDPSTPGDLADFVRLSLDTSARKNSLLAMKWTEIDFDTRQWRIAGSRSKSGKPYTVDLLSRAVKILERRRKGRTTSDFVFPAVSARRGYIHLDKPFQRLIKRIGGTLTDLRIHDLRRSSATYMARAGEPLQKIAAALGHSESNMDSVLIYAKIAQTDLPATRQAGADKMAEEMAAARKRMASQKKVPVIGRKSA